MIPPTPDDARLKEAIVVPRRALLAGALAAVVFLLLTFVGLVFTPSSTMYAYLLAFAYFGGITLAGLVLLMIFHATRARWVVVVRRPLEAVAGSVGLFLLLFLPIAFGLPLLYVWVAPPAGLEGHALVLLQHKRAYLNVPFFLLRTVLYLVIAGFIGHRLYGWSLRQDTSGSLELSRRAHRLGTGGLPLVALVFAFAAFDWLMSLTPLWYSTIFGVYYFAGSFVGAVAVLILFVTRGPAALRALASTDHLHNLGKFLFAFTCFWGYIAFSQLLLIWIAHLPEEIPFYAVRLRGPWALVSVALGLVHFVIPFFAMLSRRLKRSRRGLTVMAWWMLGAHLLDLYWLVGPTYSPERLWASLTIVTALLGVGAATATFVLWRLSGRHAVPVGDPHLAQSLAFRQP